MDINSMKELIKAVSDSELTAFEVREGNLEIRIGKNKAGADRQAFLQEYQCIGAGDAYDGKGEKKPGGIDKAEQGTKEEKGRLITTPLVGTVYLAPSEDAKPYVKIGDRVKKGQTVAIVEAMKLMNAIESEADGVVEEILVQNGQLVEYGQPLFAIL
ncbi:MAG: acetyl-CoA carboxylase biotin carboxyl carrier protein [Lachnospiraceae bacterium]|nr:acetyl-CoA carboxylase biotin carboxyl carrier protein [Lachnospiraceae bacterium]